MHERTQRAIARLLFIFCCAVPTCLTILSVLVTWTPWYHDRTIQHLQHEFQKEIGLTVKIGSYDHSAPGAWTLTNLILSHPETNQEIAKVRELHWVIQEQEARIIQLTEQRRISQEAFRVAPERGVASDSSRDGPHATFGPECRENYAALLSCATKFVLWVTFTCDLEELKIQLIER